MSLTMASFLLFLLATSLWSPSDAGDILTPHKPLADDKGTLISAGGRFELGFFSPVGSSNNRYIGIWYPNISPQTVVWVANRQRPVSGRSGSLSITTNGTLVITDGNSTIVWTSGSPVLANPIAQLFDDGNFVVRESGSNNSDPNSFAWQSFDFPTDALLPGMILGWNLTSGLNRNLTSWTNPSDPAVGKYTVGIDFHGDPQLFVWYDEQKYSRAGSWNGLQFSGIPATVKFYGMFKLDFVINSQEVFYRYYPLDPSIITRMVMNSSGTVQRLNWNAETNSWNLLGSLPNGVCSFLKCGPNGVCQHEEGSTCECLQGFHPKNPRNWDLNEGSDGCLRKTELDCKTDRFFTLSNTNLPDTSRVAVDWSMSLDECHAVCSTNCSCTAYATANISGSGSGCIIWTTDLNDLKVSDSAGGPDLHVKIAAADLTTKGSESNRSRHNHLIVVIVITAVVIFLLAFIVCCAWKRKKSTTTFFTERYNIDEGTDAKELDLPLFHLGTIMDATSNFSIDNKLGEGGFGPVYKGKLGEEQEIAVKRLSKTSKQGLDEFKNEVMLIAKLQHRNLVRLLGCCIQGGERILIYEYMSNGSLDAFLFDKTNDAVFDWRTRNNIIVGIARGLLYLHQDSRLRIIHRDLKASNILLDQDMNPKISDFGMARIFGGDETQANTRRVVGTYGYMSPEYVMDGIFSVKSDVFSFGVLLLEIITGKKNRGVYHSHHHDLNLLGYVWSLWNEGKGSELIDDSIGYSFPMAEALRCIKVGLLCVQERPEDRPTMSSVLLMLNGDTELPRPRQPGFFVLRGPSETDSSVSNQELLSINNVSMTVLEGR